MGNDIQKERAREGHRGDTAGDTGKEGACREPPPRVGGGAPGGGVWDSSVFPSCAV